MAADSQRTEGALRNPVPKLFATSANVVWGTAGPIAIQQEFQGLLEDVSIKSDRQATARDIRDALTEARRLTTQTLEGASFEDTHIEALLAWWDRHAGQAVLLWARGDGRWEFMHQHRAIGTPARHASFALSAADHLQYGTLGLEAAKTVTYDITESAIRTSATGVDLPVQMATVAASGSAVLDDLRGIRDSVVAFREGQRELLEPAVLPPPEPDTGVRPPPRPSSA